MPLTVEQSLSAVKKYIRVSIASIAFIRGLCTEECFGHRQYLSIPNAPFLLPTTPESRTLISWLQNGVFDALDRGYQKDMSVLVLNEEGSQVLESYTFSFTFDDKGAVEVTSTLQTVATQQQDPVVDCEDVAAAPPTRKRPRSDQEAPCGSEHLIRTSFNRLIRESIQQLQAQPPLTSSRCLSMRLTYHEDRTPLDYQPPSFTNLDHDAFMRQLRDELLMNKCELQDSATGLHRLGWCAKFPRAHSLTPSEEPCSSIPAEVSCAPSHLLMSED